MTDAHLAVCQNNKRELGTPFLRTFMHPLILLHMSFTLQALPSSVFVYFTGLHWEGRSQGRSLKHSDYAKIHSDTAAAISHYLNGQEQAAYE